MNYLVHLYLAGNQEESIIGNFIADHVKGNHYLKYSEGVQAGIKMHRAVDHFTDHHPIIIEVKKYFSADFGITSGILVDVFFDHLFAKEWIKNRSKEDLQNFTQNMHSVLIKHRAILPERSQKFLGYLLEYNILFQYHRIEGIEQTLRGLSKRLKDKFQLWESIKIFQQQESIIQQYYQVFIQNLSSAFKKN
jgi:acyl carrier protein phosphodiesterase